MHDLAVYVKERIPFAQVLYLENSTDSYLCFPLALLHSVPCFFFLYQSPSLPLCMVIDYISSNIDELLSIKLPFAPDLSLENSADSCLCLRLALLNSVCYFFVLY